VASERAALKDLYSQGISSWTWFKGGTGGSTVMREEFLDNDDLDPCGGSGNTSTRLAGIHCIGGHVIGIVHPAIPNQILS
jgi:hypothetical protein